MFNNKSKKEKKKMSGKKKRQIPLVFSIFNKNTSIHSSLHNVTNKLFIRSPHTTTDDSLSYIKSKSNFYILIQKIKMPQQENSKK